MRKRLYQQVASSLEEAIAAGRFAPGQRLPGMRELADDFGVSPPTIREATLALEIRGLVEARHGSGVYVVDNPQAEATSPELDIEPSELTEARALFEGEAAALAAAVITEDELAQLEMILAEMMEENVGEPRGQQADRKFHMVIAKATRNTAIARVVEYLWELSRRPPRCGRMLERARGSAVKPRIDEHRILLDALAARDPQRARKAMRDRVGG